MANNPHLLHAALAGLLHDIGKLVWRARPKAFEMPGSDQTPDNHIEEKYGYWHALASEAFVQQHLSKPIQANLLGIGYHHRPEDIAGENSQAWQVHLADQLASGENEADEDKFAPQLQSIFCHLNNYAGSKQYLLLKRLSPVDEHDLFPVSTDKAYTPAQAAQAYEELLKSLEDACQERGLAEIADPLLCLENVYALLQEFTWCVPSTVWQEANDVSLFDHLRATAAVAACLADDGQTVDTCKALKGSDQSVCFLVVADLSNLQNFIYTLASDGAAKSLRARSFYVQLLSEALALELLDQLSLPLTNLIYVGGGGFQLLAPLKAQALLKNAVSELTNRILELHQGSLGFTIRWEEIKAGEFASFNQVYDRLSQTLNRIKRRPFAAASTTQLFQAIGQPLTRGGDPIKFCAVTGEDGENLVAYKDQPNRFKSKFVDSLEELGLLLPKASYIALARAQKVQPQRATHWQQALQVFGLEVQIIAQGNKAIPMRALPGDVLRVWRLAPRASKNEAFILEPLGDRKVVSYRPFARLTPLKEDGTPKTFDELAQPQRGHFIRWGVLRMDVDNLGKLFQNGFGAQASLSRIANLSFALRLFFEGWLPQLAAPQEGDGEAKRDLRNNLYIQYAGGDDVFVVGSWDALPEFARRVRNSFSKYTAQNPSITLSAGMTIVEEKFPLNQAASQAGDAEHAAKSRRSDDKTKDAFCFLETVLDWQDFHEVQILAHQLANAIEQRRLPHSTLQTLLILQSQAAQAHIQARRKNNPKPIYGRWMWLAAYQIRRMSIAIRDLQTREQLFALQSTFTTPGADLTQIGLAARWAQFLTRGG